MSTPNVELRDALGKLRQHTHMDVPGRVKKHAQIAYSLAIMERHPPGYTEIDWALHLMDLQPHELRERLQERVDRDVAKMPEVVVGNLMEYGGSVLPAIPQQVPVGMTAKMLKLDKKWTRELFEELANKRLSAFHVNGRNKGKFMAARVAVREVFDDVFKAVGHSLMFRAKVHMKRDGAFVLMVEEIH